MAERASMPTFVPRTVASFERAATAVARRVAAPVRLLATRALSFADRVVGTWTAQTTTTSAVEGARPAMRAATRGSGMPLPRPWYEVDADEDAIWPQQAAAVARTAAAAMGVAATRLPPAAERGTAIARTALTAAPDLAARATETAARETAARETAARETAARETAAPGAGNAAHAVDASAETRALAASVTTDVRVAEALGLRSAIASAPALTTRTAPMAQATTPLGRALAHAAWVDAQLRAVAPAVDSAARATPGYVFVAPADLEGALESGREPSTTAVRQQTTAATMPALVAGSAATATAARASGVGAVRAAAMPDVAAWSAGLPDPRLPATQPTPSAQRIADFMARLVGVQSERDAASLATATATATAMAAPMSHAGIAATAPVAMPSAATRAASPARTFVVLEPPASWRPGAAAARVEQLGARVDARVSAAWGEPTTTPMIDRRSAESALVASAAQPTSSKATERALPAGEQILVAPFDAPARATGPARLSQFVQQLVGVQAARATAPLPVQRLVAARAAAAASDRAAAATDRPAVTASGRAPARVTLAGTTEPAATLMPAATLIPATTMPTATMQAARMPASGARPTAIAAAETTTAPGGIGRRAEQLGGVIGVRAASLSIDFVDPARLSLLTGAAPSMPTVTPGAEAPTSAPLMPAPQPPPFAMPKATSIAPALTAEEWSLVATFPSSATAVQLATARQSAHWGDGAPATRAALAPARTMLSTIAAGEATAARAGERGAAARGLDASGWSPAARGARGGVPAEFVAPTAGPTETHARLPGGRTPRGSFTWPKLADYTPSRAEWAAPASAAVAVAEQTKQMAPGTPLWGAMPALIAVSPSLAAAGFAGTTAPPEGASRASAPEATSAPHERAHGGAPTAGVTIAAATGGAAAAGADAPALTLMTAAATRESRAAARTGARESSAADDGEPRRDVRLAAAMPMTGAAEAMRGTAAGAPKVSNVRPSSAMPLMTAGPAGRDGGQAGASVGPAARALELARPFLRLVEGSITGETGAQRSAGGPRFFEQPQPLVAGAPSSDSASRIVEALRSQPTGPSSDDRVSLADLTLIAIASATQQVAASPAGGGPGGGAAASAPAASAPAAASGHAGRSENPAQEIEELARAAFDELQRLFAMARERSGEHG